MRKKTIVFGIIELILIVYGCIACNNIRGLQIYLISYELGKVFVYTYIPVLLVAAIGLFIVIKLVKKDIQTLKEKKAQGNVTKSELKNDSEKKTEKKIVEVEQKDTLKQKTKEQEQNVSGALEGGSGLCSQCGAEVGETQKFCTKCGNKLR